MYMCYILYLFNVCTCVMIEMNYLVEAIHDIFLLTITVRIKLSLILRQRSLELLYNSNGSNQMGGGKYRL